MRLNSSNRDREEVKLSISQILAIRRGYEAPNEEPPPDQEELKEEVEGEDLSLVPNSGLLIDGKYKVKKKLAEGGFGKVYLAVKK